MVCRCSLFFGRVHRIGDKIWRECKCGKRRGNGWCCKNQPWEHAFCALVSRVPSLAHPSISSPAGASAPSGVSGPAGSSAPDGVAGPLGRSTRLCGNSAADRSSQQVRAQTRAIEFEHRVTEPELTLTQGLAEWGGRTQMPLSSIQVRCECIQSRCWPLQHCIHDRSATVSRWC